MCALAHDLAERGGVAGLSIHPRHASQRHAGTPDYELAAELVAELPVPVLISGGLRSAELARAAFERTGADAILLARGSLGNPWLFEQLVALRDEEPSRDEILDELSWVLDRAVEHLGEERANRYLRKFYPWYVERLGGTRAEQRALQAALQQPQRCPRRARCSPASARLPTQPDRRLQPHRAANRVLRVGGAQAPGQIPSAVYTSAAVRELAPDARVFCSVPNTT